MGDARRSNRCQALAGGFVLALSVMLLIAAPWAAASAQETTIVMVTRVDDPITPIIADHLVELLDRAEAGGYEALVVELDTPGGLDSAMRDIVQAFLSAEVPVVVYVSPSGARAASAGALISWASHLVAMAPGTTIGAATPVTLEGGEVGDKVVNDAAAYARAIAEERGRDVDVAADAVTEGEALSSSEAIDNDVADLLAADRAVLLDELDGVEVELPDGTEVALETADAAVEEHDLSFFRSLLQRLADPNLAFLFLSLGTLAIIYELATPGIGVGGGLGAVLLLLALFSIAVLPVNIMGLLFLALAGGLFVAELFAPGIGVAAVLGSVSLALSGIFMFREDTPGLSLSLAAVLPTVGVVAIAVIIAGRLTMRSRSAPATTGSEALLGREVLVARAAGGSGQAFVEGAWWTVRADDALEAGDQVRVQSVDGLDLMVERVMVDRVETGETDDEEETS